MPPRLIKARRHLIVREDGSSWGQTIYPRESRALPAALLWIAVASAMTLAACSSDSAPPTPTISPDTPSLALGEPSDMVRQYVDDQLAELGQGSTSAGEGRAARVRCADLSEKYLGDGEWEVTTAFDGRSVPRVWRVHESTGEVEDLLTSEPLPC